MAQDNSIYAIDRLLRDDSLGILAHVSYDATLTRYHEDVVVRPGEFFWSITHAREEWAGRRDILDPLDQLNSYGKYGKTIADCPYLRCTLYTAHVARTMTIA